MRLLRTPAPYSGESFLGYLLRLTEENGYDSLHWITEMVGLNVNPAEVRSLEILSTEPKISMLREITGLIEAELESLRRTLVPRYLLGLTAPKVCSVCLKEKSYCRKAWDVLLFTVCPLHRVILIDSCPHCHQSLRWRRKNVSVCNCGYDWRRISPPVVEDDGELIAVRRMLSIWRENEPCYFPLEDATKGPFTREIPAVYQDALYALSDAWLFLRNDARLQATENGLCHRAVTSMASAPDDWPESFFRFCDEFDTEALRNLERLWYLYRYRGSGLSDTEGLRLFVEALEEYRIGRQDGVRPTLETLLSIEEAGRELGLGVSHVERLVEQGKLKVERMRLALNVAIDLGIGLSPLGDLERYGWLLPDNGPRINGLDERKFSEKTLDAFLDRIRGLVTPPCDADVYNVISLGRVADHLGVHGLSFGRFMQSMDSGFPRPVVEREGPPGRLSQFWFRVDEINQYLDSQIDPEKRPAAVHEVMPSLSKVVEWLERKQEEFDKRFYYGYPQPPQARNQRAGFANIYTADQLRRLMRLQCERTRVAGRKTYKPVE